MTAGPTHEKIDPVRFISNYSSGKMGYAIAEQLLQNGANVILITGATHMKLVHPNLKKIQITTAKEMYEHSVKNFPAMDGAILCAAVADFTPIYVAKNKIKSEKLTIQLTPTKDIAQKLGSLKMNNQILIGFALETHNEIQNAIAKRKKKKLDFIVLNSLQDEGAGFQHNTNKITIIDKNDKIEYFKLKSKMEVAQDIIDKILKKMI